MLDALMVMLVAAVCAGAELLRIGRPQDLLFRSSDVMEMLALQVLERCS